MRSFALFLESPTISTGNVEVIVISESYLLNEITEIYMILSLQEGLICKPWLLLLVLAPGKYMLRDEYSEQRRWGSALRGHDWIPRHQEEVDARFLGSNHNFANRLNYFTMKCLSSMP